MNCKRYLVVCLIAICAILAASVAAVAIQATTVQGATGGVLYGAGAYTGSNPIGGGAGYVSPHGYSEDTADYVVTTASGLTSALASATSGDVIWIPGDVTIGISGFRGVTVPAGVAIASDRGTGGSDGALLSDTSSSGIAFSARHHAVFSGLRFKNTHPTASSRTLMSSSGGAWGIEWENCEIKDFGYIGIWLGSHSMAWDSPDRNWVHHCTISGFQQTGLGYGIGLTGTSVLVECNKMYNCRHLISGQRTLAGAPVTNYEFRYNECGDALYWQSGWSYNVQTDQHGGNDSQAWGNPNPPNASTCAGGTLKIHHNTYTSNSGQANVGIRGIPGTVCEVYNNWTKKTAGASGAHDETSPRNGAFEQQLENLAGKTYEGKTITAKSFIHMSVHDNWYGTAAPAGESQPPEEPPETPELAAAFTAAVTGLQVQCTDGSAGGPASWSWSFGDGATSTARNPSHTYGKAGTYTIALTVRDDAGAADSASRTVTVGTAPQSASIALKTFTIPRNPVSLGATYTLVAQVANEGDASGSAVVEFGYISGGTRHTLETRTVTVGARSTVAVSSADRKSSARGDWTMYCEVGGEDLTVVLHVT